MEAKKCINNFLLPAKLLIPQNVIAKIPFLTTNEEIRREQVLPHISGMLLDIGCGMNKLVRDYKMLGGSGVGVDMFDWGQQDVLLVDSMEEMPFENASFDTITIVACLNYFSNREQVLEEANRVLKINGKIVLTMVSPFLMRIWNSYKFWDRGINDLGKNESEAWGFTRLQMQEMLQGAGFKLKRVDPFSWGLNRLYLANKTDFTSER